MVSGAGRVFHARNFMSKLVRLGLWWYWWQKNEIRVLIGLGVEQSSNSQREVELWVDKLPEKVRNRQI